MTGTCMYIKMFILIYYSCSRSLFFLWHKNQTRSRPSICCDF